MVLTEKELLEIKEYPKGIEQILKKQKLLSENLPQTRKKTIEDIRMSIISDLTILASKSFDETKNFITFENKRERYSRKSESTVFVTLFQNVMEFLNALIDKKYVSKENMVEKVGYIYDKFPVSIEKNPLYEKKEEMEFFRDLIKPFTKISLNSNKEEEIIKDLEKFFFNLFNYANNIKINKSVVNVCFQKKFLRYIEKYKIIENYQS
jgi:hypothetical protein